MARAREYTYPLRLSTEELTAIRAAAKRERRPIAGYLRWAALEAAQKQAQPQQRPPSDRAVMGS